MLSTKNIITNLKDVPQTWIFEYYCNLEEPLTGQNVKLKSFFIKIIVARLSSGDL